MTKNLLKMHGLRLTHEPFEIAWFKGNQELLKVHGLRLSHEPFEIAWFHWRNLSFENILKWTLHIK